MTQPVSSNLLSEEPDGVPPHKDIGVRLAWDDEQLLIWQNRQMLSDPATPGKRVDAPLGVFFYRVDAREAGDPDWHSLVRVRSKTALTLAGQTIAPAQTKLETGVQVFPAKVNGAIDTAYWLPSYFSAVVRRLARPPRRPRRGARCLRRARQARLVQRRQHPGETASEGRPLRAGAVRRLRAQVWP